MFAPRICFVDLETTGASSSRDRVTEVGVVAVECEGDDVRVREWSSLVNPEMPIPSEIQWLTGITNDMVRTAPRFRELTEMLLDQLHDAIFVAHNARFDYGFLKAEFARLGMNWSARTLCTVRLSRQLYPDRSPHSLDAIVARFGLDGEQRHRALGDARVLWRFVQRLYEHHPRAEVEGAIDQLLSRPATPQHLPPNALDDIPHAPGVYLFYGLNAHPIYIGKSLDLRTRVAAHFSADHANATDAKLAQETHRIEWEETAGEFGALLREAELIKTRLPAHNIVLRRKLSQVLIALDDIGGPRFIPAPRVPLAELPQHIGPFSSRASARQFLLHLATERQLCLKTLGLERRKRGEAQDAPCFAYQLKRCAGACVGTEPLAQHAERTRAALGERHIAPWPFAGAIALLEKNAERHRCAWHVFDRWCWLGSVGTEDAAHALAQAASNEPPHVFEPDVYRLLRKALKQESISLLPLHGEGKEADESAKISLSDLPASTPTAKSPATFPTPSMPTASR